MRVCPYAFTCAVSHEDLFKVGAAIFNLHKDVGDGAVQAAAPFIELSSEAGNTDARYTLAQLLRTGRGVECNVARAASLFQELAMKAHPYAQVGLSTQPERVCASNGDSPPPLGTRSSCWGQCTSKALAWITT